MTDFRSILVHLDGSTHAALRLDLARQLAARQQAALNAMFAVVPRLQPLPLAMAEGAPVVPMVDAIDERHRAQAQKTFDDGTRGQASRWLELNGHAPIAGFTAQAFYNDLLVLGQHDAGDPGCADVPHDFVESVIIDSGKPAWVLPRRAKQVDAQPHIVVVAWKPTRESARAVSAALPFLRQAQTVHVAVAPEPQMDGDAARDQIADYLQQQGVRELRTHQALAGKDAGDALLSLAFDVGAELLVMGCYGHSRTRELLMGGASRTVLRTMTLPVLMAH